MDEEFEKLIEQNVELFAETGLEGKDLEFLRQCLTEIADIAFIKGKIEEQDKRINELKKN